MILLIWERRWRQQLICFHFIRSTIESNLSSFHKVMLFWIMLLTRKWLWFQKWIEMSLEFLSIDHCCLLWRNDIDLFSMDIWTVIFWWILWSSLLLIKWICFTRKRTFQYSNEDDLWIDSICFQSLWSASSEHFSLLYKYQIFSEILSSNSCHNSSYRRKCCLEWIVESRIGYFPLYKWC